MDPYSCPRCGGEKGSKVPACGPCRVIIATEKREADLARLSAVREERAAEDTAARAAYATERARVGPNPTWGVTGED